MKNEQNAYTSFTKSRRKYNARQIAKGVGLGASLAGFGAAMKGAFDQIDLSNIGEFVGNIGTKALEFYREIAEKLNPGASVPAYIFLGLVGGFIVLMVRGRIVKRKFETRTVEDLSVENEELAAANHTLTENNETLQKVLTTKHKKPATEAAPSAPAAE